MRRNTMQARQLLRKLIAGRITFTPGPEGVTFAFRCLLGPVLAG